MFVPILIVAAKPGSVGPFLRTLSMMQIIFPFTCVGGSICLGHSCFAVYLIFNPLTITNSAVYGYMFSLPVSHVVEPLSEIVTPVLKADQTKSRSHLFFIIRTGIDVTRFQSMRIVYSNGFFHEVYLRGRFSQFSEYFCQNWRLQPFIFNLLRGLWAIIE